MRTRIGVSALVALAGSGSDFKGGSSTPREPKTARERQRRTCIALACLGVRSGAAAVMRAVELRLFGEI